MSINGFEFIALFFEPLQGLRQGKAKFVDTFKRIVKRDDRSVSGVSFHVVKDVFSGHPFGVIACHDVPHDNFVFPAEPGILTESHPSMRRSKEVRVNEFVGLSGVIAIGADGVSCTTHMVVGMITHAMSGVEDLAVEMGMSFYVLSHHEESGQGIVLGQGFEDEGSRLGDGPVVEGEVDGAFPFVHPPQSVGIKPT